MSPPTPAIASSSPAVILRSARIVEQVEDERERRSARPRGSGRLRLRASRALPPAQRRRGSRRASRRSRRRRRPSALTWSCVRQQQRRRVEVLRSGGGRGGDRLDARDDRAARRAARRAAGRRRSAGRRAAGRRRRSTRGSSRPPLGDDRGLASDPRQRAEDHVELRVDRRDGRLERAQVLGLDRLPARRASVASAFGDPTPAPRGPGSAPPRAPRRRRPRARR